MVPAGRVGGVGRGVCGGGGEGGGAGEGLVVPVAAAAAEQRVARAVGFGVGSYFGGWPRGGGLTGEEGGWWCMRGFEGGLFASGFVVRLRWRVSEMVGDRLVVSRESSESGGQLRDVIGSVGLWYGRRPEHVHARARRQVWRGSGVQALAAWRMGMGKVWQVEKGGRIRGRRESYRMDD